MHTVETTADWGHRILLHADCVAQCVSKGFLMDVRLLGETDCFSRGVFF